MYSNSPPPTSQQNPYDFFLNPAPAPKQRGINKFQLKKPIFVVGGIILLFIVIFSLLLGGGGNRAQVLRDIAQQQTELIRVSLVAEEKSKNQATLSVAITTRLAITSSKTQLLQVATESGIKISEKDLAQGDAQTDQLFTEALNNNKFDEVFVRTLRESLTTYQASLQEAFDSAKGSKEKTMLQFSYNQVQTLLDQLKD